ncbi:DNA polymerase III subunit alpha [Mucilaginibacter lappiensis]|uniref:DNA polymerase III subunit alpha n=1 Tax=Mucilaginibacter lappiensis TaxID=354630 RepID=UPI003D1D985E
MYVNCKTFFSYRYGTYETEELVKQAKAMDISALALTNINGTPDAWDFVHYCRDTKEGTQPAIHPILGSEIRNSNKFCYLLIARNDTGIMHINRFISRYKVEDKPFPERPVIADDVYIIYALGKYQPHELLDNELIGVRVSEINRLFSVPVKNHPQKFIIRQPVTFQNKKNFNVHRLLRAIDLNTLLSKLTPDDVASPDEMFMPEAELMTRFREYPTLIARTQQLMEDCGTDMVLKTDKNKKTFTGSLQGDQELLRELTLKGMALRYKQDPVIMERIEKELTVVSNLNFNSYFLIVWDIVRFAREKGFYYVGRGSGANSIIAYCLKITDVDPIKLDLYFERFLNKFRTSPPDFDMDFSHKDRDQIIRYVFNKYGNERVALLGMHATFQRRATIRELGKVMGLPKEEIDILVKDRNYIHPEDSIQKVILKYVDAMKNFPNHLSIHAGGMLISEEPVYQYTSVEMPPKGFATSRIDMFEAEQVGLIKLDILSQRGLGHIKDTIQLVKQNQDISIDIEKVEDFMTDPKVADQIRRADTIGCFYIESPAMRQLLMKLKCDDYLTLVAASSIIRPGVSQSGMMKAYIQNYHNQDKVQYLHPKMEELLKETFGIMVYQEDVIKIAHHFGGLDMAEADILRRAMSGKYRGNEEMIRIEGKFFSNCREKGYPPDISKEVWRQIASFSGYSFSKAHSASFAVESYQSLYLKTYFPMEFMVGVINNFGGFYRTPFYFHELKKTGAKLHAPCVNQSDIYTNIKDHDVYVGLVHIERLTSSLLECIITERHDNEPYLSMEDFMERTLAGMEQLNILIRIGALRFTGMTKQELLWRANFFQKQQQEQPVATTTLFNEPATDFKLPELSARPLQDAFDEIEILGFALTDTFPMVDDDGQGLTYVKELPAKLGQTVKMLGQLVTIKESSTIKREIMNFGTFLDPHGDWLDTVHWPESLKRYTFQGSGFYRMTGKVVAEFGVYAVEVWEMHKIGYKMEMLEWV